MAYTTVFFDWGGVIADDPGDDFLEKMLIECGATEAQRREIFTTYMKDFMAGKISESEYWNILKDTFALPIDESFSARIMDWVGLKANPEVLKHVAQLKSRGYKVAILSNVIEPSYNAIQKAGFYDLFDEVIGSCKEGFIKPQKEIYDIALERTGAKAEESIFIDDKEKCLAPAREMGFTTIQAQSAPQFLSELKRLTA